MPRRKTSAASFIPVATDEERRIAAEVEALLPEPLASADRVAFTLLAAKIAEWLDLRAICQSAGITQYSDRSGVSHLSPEARREAEVFAEVIALCKEFGMTPRSRARMAAALGKDAAAAKPPVFCGFISADPGKPAE